MEISRIRALRGPNLWTRNTAIEAVITCSEAELSIERLPEFERALREQFPDLPAFRPDPDGLVSLAHVVEIVTLSLQTMIGCPVTFSRTSRTVEPGVFQVVVEYDEESIGRQAIELAEQLCRSAGTGDSFTLSAALEQLKERYEDLRLGPSTGSIVNAALARDIPIRRLTEGSLVQFGWGSRQRRIQAAESDRTSAIAEAIAQDKELTKKLLHAAGISVPRGRPVDNEADAWQAALSLGGPVVVKPQDSNQGRGISVNVIGEQAVIAAYRRAAEVSTDVLVEEYLPGLDHRFLIVDGRLIAAARREPPQVTGDGSLTIAQLVEQVNADPRRGSGHATSLTKIPLDAIAVSCLAEQGYGVDSVLPLGVRVYLRNNANLSTGGTATDVTDDVHPELAASAVAAAHAVGLDICGIDVVCETVLRPLEDQGGGIVEVNAAPGLRMHLTPSFGKGRPVGEAVIAMMFPDPGDNGRIPVVAVAGTNGKTTTVRLIENILSRNGYRTGMTTTDGIYVEGQRIDTGDCSGPRSARNVLLHPDVDAAVFETARGGVLREGLGFDRCNVAVVTNIGQGDHLGLNYITTVEDLAVVKRVIVENVAPPKAPVPAVHPPEAPSSKKWIGIGAAVAVLVVGTGLYFALHKTTPAPTPETGVKPETTTTTTAPTAPPAPSFGMLAVEAKDDKGANIDGADIFVDNQLKDAQIKSGKATLKLSAGQHQVRIDKAGYDAGPAQSVQIAKDGEAPLKFVLKKSAEAAAAPPPKPYLMITSTPGATIKVDQKSIENVGPDGKYSFQVDPGKHRVELTLRGYQPWSQTVSAKAGERVPVNAALIAVPPPLIEFSANPSSIKEGQSTELKWETQNATEVTIEGLGTVPAKGSRQVTPQSSTTYTLIAKGEGQPAQKAIAVSVAAAPIPKPSIGRFAVAGSSTIQRGEKVRLEWATDNATDVSIEGIGKVDARGSREVSPAETTTYVLTASGRGGSVSSQPVRIAVEAPRAAAPPAPAGPDPAALKAKDVAAIKDLIERQLKAAYESMNMAELVRVWPNMPKNTRDETKGLFQSGVKNFKTDYRCEPSINGDAASARCSQSLSFVMGGKPQSINNSLVFTLKRVGGAWQLQDSHR